MKRNLILLQILLLSFLVSTYIQAQQPDLPLDHSTNENLIKEPLTVKFHKPRSSSSPYFFVPLGFSSQNMNIDLVLTTKTSAVWINSYYYNDVLIDSRFTCSTSTSCHSEEPLKFSIKNNADITGQGMLVKEQVTLGGVALQNIGIFMATRFSKEGYGFLKDLGMFGLGVQRSNPKAPTLQEYFQEPVVTMSFEDHYGGNLIYGGYPSNTTRADFGFVQVNNGDKSIKDGGFSVPIRGIGYENNSTLEGKKAIINFEIPYISLPKSALKQINDLVMKQGLLISYPGHRGANPFRGQPVSCKARDILGDLVVEFEGFSVRIPASAYIIRTTEYPFLKGHQVEPKAESCFLTLAPEDFMKGNIVLGEPFFKAHDVVFDSEKNSLGFSHPYWTTNPNITIADPDITNSSNTTDPDITKSPNKTDPNTSTKSPDITASSMDSSQNVKNPRKNLYIIIIGLASLLILGVFLCAVKNFRKWIKGEKKLVQAIKILRKNDNTQHVEGIAGEELANEEMHELSAVHSP